MNRSNHIFVDYENVQKVDLDLVGKEVIVHLVLGERHKNLPVEMFEQGLKCEGQLRLIKAGKSGKNALDFVLAYHLGLESAADPTGTFHIVSRDTGFDPLILHLCARGLEIRRDETFAKALDLTGKPGPAIDRVQFVIEKLTKNKSSRPRRKKTLLSNINSYFQKKLTEPELEEIVNTLINRKLIEIGAKNEVGYQM